MSFNLQESFRRMNIGDVLLSYKGSISADLITNVLDIVESKLKEVDTSVTAKKKIYNVLVESLQNLYHHIEDPPEPIKNEYTSKFAVLVVSKLNDNYRISTGNFVKASKVQQLKEKIEKINSMSVEELREMYKYLLNHQKLSEKGGGGLGLIDIAKKTGNKFDYMFQSYNKDFYFFCLNIFINEN